MSAVTGVISPVYPGWVVVSGVPLLFDVIDVYLRDGIIHIVARADAAAAPVVATEDRVTEIYGPDGQMILTYTSKIGWDLGEHPGTVTLDYPVAITGVEVKP